MTEPAFLTATRTSYDAVAADYAEQFHGELDTRPLDRAFVAAFAEHVRGRGPVADVGCGPGQYTGLLHDLGVDVFGIDLSPGMLDVARRRRPHLRFVEGTMTALDLPDRALAGLSACYSIIHVPQERLPGVFTEFHRVLAPGGHVMLAFQVGDEVLHLDERFGHDISLDIARRRPDDVADLLARAGLPVTARLLREPVGTEKTPQAYLLAAKPAG